MHLRRGFCSTKKYKVKPYTIFNHNVCFSLTPVRALFKETLGQVRLPKTGGMLVEMIPYHLGSSKEKVHNFGWQNRIFFDANIQNVGVFVGLGLDVIRGKPVQYEMESENRHGGEITKTKMLVECDKEERWHIEMQSTKTQGKTAFSLNPQTLQLQKSPGVPSSDSEVLKYKMELSRAQIISVSELCRYCLPFVLGWDVLAESKQFQLPTDGRY